MNVNTLIINTLKPIIPNNDTTVPQPSNIVPTKYTGSSTIYVTFNYTDDRALDFADDEPQEDVASLQIHLFCPRTYNFNLLKKQIRSRLFGAGFSYPSVVTLYEDDTETNHIVFECEISGESESEE